MGDLLKTLSDLVTLKSVSCTEGERLPAQYIYEQFSSLEYFRKNSEYVGKHYIEKDQYGRFVTYALIKGRSSDTVILSGHIDVVSAEVYGDAEDVAFSIGDELHKKLASMNMTDNVRKDFESDEWIWGRGAADMKAGVAIAMSIVEEYAELAERGELEGSLLFMAVPDEESYSAGMRSAVHIMKELREKYSLKYKLLIDPEPATESDGAQVMSLGTVGKSMPVVMTQGVVAHMGHCFEGISGLNMLAGIYQRTNGSLDFSDTYESEASMPALWGAMKDMKLNYDVSLPHRGFGYMTVLSFDKTVEDVIEKFRSIAEEVFEDEVRKLNSTYQKFTSINSYAKKKEIHYDTRVYSVEELCSILEKQYGERFLGFFENAKKEALEQVRDGKSFPDATVYVMNELLNFADIKEPLILIGVAPPYYPATHSDRIEGKEGFGTKIFEFAKELSEKKYGQKLTYENYFMGISDNSYTSVPELDYEKLTKNYPLWGDGYDIAFDEIAELSVPSILYGPIGKEYHQWTERLNKRSFLEIMPGMLRSVIEYAWSL